MDNFGNGRLKLSDRMPTLSNQQDDISDQSSVSIGIDDIIITGQNSRGSSAKTRTNAEKIL